MWSYYDGADSVTVVVRRTRDRKVTGSSLTHCLLSAVLCKLLMHMCFCYQEV